MSAASQGRRPRVQAGEPSKKVSKSGPRKFKFEESLGGGSSPSHGATRSRFETQLLITPLTAPRWRHSPAQVQDTLNRWQSRSTSLKFECPARVATRKKLNCKKSNSPPSMEKVAKVTRNQKSLARWPPSGKAPTEVLVQYGQ